MIPIVRQCKHQLFITRKMSVIMQPG